MQKMALGVAFAFASGWCAADLAQADEPKEKGTFEVVIQTDGAADGEPVQHAIVVTDEDADGEFHVFHGVGLAAERRVAVGADRERVNLAMAVEEDAADRGWLGVTLSVISDELREDVGDVEGLAIRNVAKGSAAEVAGFLQNDVITEINDVAISGLESLVNAIGDAGPGARVKFTVLRDGQRRNLVATLGDRTEMKEIEWVYDVPSEINIRNRTRFRVLAPENDGNMWVLRNMDDEVLENLPEHVREMLRRVENHSVNVSVGENGMHVEHSVVLDGETINVEREGDGPIIVTRIDVDGNETVSEYVDEDELAENDADASRIFAHHGRDWMSGFHSGRHRAFTIDGAGGLGRWVAEFEANMEDADGSLQEMIEKLHNVEVDVSDEMNAARVHIAALQKSHRTIRENPDGSIEVVVRKGGDELVTVYTDLADLEARNPDAFDKYQELQETE